VRKKSLQTPEHEVNSDGGRHKSLAHSGRMAGTRIVQELALQIGQAVGSTLCKCDNMKRQAKKKATSTGDEKEPAREVERKRKSALSL